MLVIIPFLILLCGIQGDVIYEESINDGSFKRTDDDGYNRYWHQERYYYVDNAPDNYWVHFDDVRVICSTEYITYQKNNEPYLVRYCGGDYNLTGFTDDHLVLLVSHYDEGINLSGHNRYMIRVRQGIWLDKSQIKGFNDAQLSFQLKMNQGNSAYDRFCITLHGDCCSDLLVDCIDYDKTINTTDFVGYTYNITNLVRYLIDNSYYPYFYIQFVHTYQIVGNNRSNSIYYLDDVSVKSGYIVENPTISTEPSTESSTESSTEPSNEDNRHSAELVLLIFIIVFYGSITLCVLGWYLFQKFKLLNFAYQPNSAETANIETEILMEEIPRE